MLKVVPVPVLVPADEFFAGTFPTCDNSISATGDIAYLVCSDRVNGVEGVISVDPETWEHRSRIVKLFIDDNHKAYAIPYFPEERFGYWVPGGAYIMVPLEVYEDCGCGYRFWINNTAVPLHDSWNYLHEPKVGSWLPF